MKLIKGLGTVLCLAVLCVVIAPKAKADNFNHKTSVTFSQPVEIPGVGQHLLPAGTYVFKLANSYGDRHIVQVFNEDESQVLTTILAVPNYRLKANGKTVITFHETPAGQPEAIKAWFYPGSLWGEHFVYERSRAVQLAQESNEAVLSTPVVMASSKVDDLNAAPLEAVNPNGETADTATVVEAPPVAVAETAPVEEAVVTPAPAVAPEPVEVAQNLPTTASDLPLIGLFGLLSLGGGIVLTGILKRVA
jgi:hypothetical protein